MKNSTQTGFTLIEIAIVLVIVSILLGYTVAMLPRQQELKQYRAVKQQMDEVIEAIVGFAQVNGRLPCPAYPNSSGLEAINVGVGCLQYGGFVPVNTLGLAGRLNADSLLQDPWGNPYRYYVTNVDFNANDLSDFTFPGEMRRVGLVDSESHAVVIPPRAPGDGYIDLDGRYLICDDAGDPAVPNSLCLNNVASVVFGRYDATAGVDDLQVRYGGAPFVLLSQGKNWNQGAAAGDELENRGSTTTAALTMAAGPSTALYVLKNVAVGQTTFVRPRAGMSDNFDDIVRWVSPSILFSRMIQAGQLP
jgi:prepilin-type N-terminal cleavage/methylation domain-containing protein